MKAVNIIWDTDGDKKILKGLPKEMEIPKDIDVDDIEDYLSDETGYCHFGYQLEESYHGEFKERIINAIRETAGEYLKWGEHKSLISFCCCLGAFEGMVFSGELPDDMLTEFDNTDFVVIVEKDWLFDVMKSEGVDDPQYYLENEYDSDDSEVWFEKAAHDGKIAALLF